MSVVPPDFTELLSSTGPLLPDLEGRHSPMAKVELERSDISEAQKQYYRNLPASRYRGSIRRAPAVGAAPCD
jgi:hypothetical protein